MASKFIELRGITIGTTTELAAITGTLGEDHAAYNKETGELFIGPGTISSLQKATVTSLEAADILFFQDASDGFRVKKITAANAKTYLNS